MYGPLAYVYDEFMGGTPYEKWVGSLRSLFLLHRTSPRLILDLGCGTGNITTIMAKKGYDMIGLDSSVDMLNVAREKAQNENLDILYINQDMRRFELYGTVDACISVCDAMNYLLTDSDFIKTLKLVKNYLNPGSFFIFDLNTAHAFEAMDRSGTFGEARAHSAFICETRYKKSKALMEYAVDFFLDSEKTGVYKRFAEKHVERAYSLSELTGLISAGGMKTAGIYDAVTLGAPDGKSKRVYVAAENVN